MADTTRNIAASQLPSRWTSVIDDVRESRHSWIVTEGGLPIARVVPWPEAAPESRQGDDFRDLLGSVRYGEEEDLLAPIEASWDAET